MLSNRIRHGPVEHGVDAADSIGGELMTILRMLMHPALFPQLRIQPLDVCRSDGSHFLTAQTGIDVLFRIDAVSAHGTLPQTRGGILVQPAIQPLGQCHAAVLTQLYVPEYLDVLVKLGQQRFLRRGKNVLEDRFAVFFVPHHNAAFPAAIFPLAHHAVPGWSAL